MADPNILLLTYDSCRFDVLVDADTPVLDSFADVVPAQTPANFTFPAHQAFFVGILPNAIDDLPFYNRFRKQLLGLVEVGETNVARHALMTVASQGNLLTGLRSAGYQVVGAGAMNWFRQESLTWGFEDFSFTGTDADAQIRFLLERLDHSRRFFGFINFGETHAPFDYAGKRSGCPVDVRARVMTWPPVERGPVGRPDAPHPQLRPRRQRGLPSPDGGGGVPRQPPAPSVLRPARRHDRDPVRRSRRVLR